MDSYLRKPLSPSALSEAICGGAAAALSIIAVILRRRLEMRVSAMTRHSGDDRFSTMRTRSLMMRFSSKSFGV